MILKVNHSILLQRNF